MNTTPEMTANEIASWPRILLMEDELSVAKGLQMILSEAGYVVDLAMTGKSALERFGQKVFDLLVADLKLPDINGMDVIRQVKEKCPETGVVVITGYSTVSSAVEAMKLGVYDYLPKPFTDDEFKSVIEGALKEKEAAPVKNLVEKVDTAEGKLIQKQEVLKVLTRAGQDDAFWLDLLENGSAALKDYQLSSRAKAAIVSGDLNWLNRQVGSLTEKQLAWVKARLAMERW